MRDYPTLHLDINSSKGTVFLLLFYISAIAYFYRSSMESDVDSIL
jgi:cbb3-type cytochrome oxidase subunit 3